MPVLFFQFLQSCGNPPRTVNDGVDLKHTHTHTPHTRTQVKHLYSEALQPCCLPEELKGYGESSFIADLLVFRKNIRERLLGIRDEEERGKWVLRWFKEYNLVEGSPTLKETISPIDMDPTKDFLLRLEVTLSPMPPFIGCHHSSFDHPPHTSHTNTTILLLSPSQAHHNPPLDCWQHFMLSLRNIETNIATEILCYSA